MDEAAFKKAIGAMDGVAFCRKHLFDQTAWIFSPASGVSTLGTYQDFQLSVANFINTSPNNVAMVGSAKYGFSMSPSKDYRAFDPSRSDVDVVVVSEEIFNQLWLEIRSAIHAGYSHLRSQHSSEIILRFLVLAGEATYNSAYLRETSRTIKGLAAELNKSTRIANPFKFRIYSSWSDAEAYHASGIRTLRDKK